MFFILMGTQNFYKQFEHKFIWLVLFYIHISPSCLTLIIYCQSIDFSRNLRGHLWNARNNSACGDLKAERWLQATLPAISNTTIAAYRLCVVLTAPVSTSEGAPCWGMIVRVTTPWIRTHIFHLSLCLCLSVYVCLLGC